MEVSVCMSGMLYADQDNVVGCSDLHLQEITLWLQQNVDGKQIRMDDMLIGKCDGRRGNADLMSNGRERERDRVTQAQSEDETVRN